MRTQTQLELGLNKNRVAVKNTPKRRISTAAWWFNQMRLVVDAAFDWSNTPPARPEQTWLHLAPARVRH
jgi:hypothetical protein